MVRRPVGRRYGVFLVPRALIYTSPGVTPARRFDIFPLAIAYQFSFTTYPEGLDMT
jgi:hypothetical protein